MSYCQSIVLQSYRLKAIRLCKRTVPGLSNLSFNILTNLHCARNWELMAPWTGAKVHVPTKFIVGDGDLAYHHPGVKSYIHKGGLKRDAPMLEEVVVIRGAGHFIQQERAQEISDHIYDYIKKFHTGGSTPKLSKL